MISPPVRACICMITKNCSRANSQDHIYDAKFYPYANEEDDSLVAFTCSTDKSKEKPHDGSKKRAEKHLGGLRGEGLRTADQVRLILVSRIVEDAQGNVDLAFISICEDKTEFEPTAKVRSPLD